ncbi:TetR/AcrR family transcriptional regulator [Psychromicrobium lacuslunae]|uniref:TetR/AcrR family transcriptional regulator n=1 Tax=Psychromicrobium lacuslunae TaxID=1618207 RepID=UPI001F1D8895|nr:TetR/AcrR family transcriptional regulator [Psychromicrobium lacuslunae]
MTQLIEPTNRRELNKAATREAIVVASLALLRERGLNKFTVEDVAAAAGISRRTFFNYFSSAEAAIASTTEGFLDQVIGEFAQRPLEESLLEAALQALRALIDPARLATVAEVYSLTEAHDAVGRFQSEVWSDCEAKLVVAAQPRVDPEANPLYIRALVGSIMACGKAAMEIWFSRHGTAINEATLKDLRNLLIEAIGHLRDGFVLNEPTKAH